MIVRVLTTLTQYAIVSLKLNKFTGPSSFNLAFIIIIATTSITAEAIIKPQVKTKFSIF